LDIQNLYNFKAEQPDELIQVRDSNGDPIVLPDAPPRYELKYLKSESGTLLPTVGIIVEL
ncbi:MAG: hypothetical protein ACOYN4_21240, partial [Bacteroidales bacterium]